LPGTSASSLVPGAAAPASEAPWSLSNPSGLVVTEVVVPAAVPALGLGIGPDAVTVQGLEPSVPARRAFNWRATEVTVPVLEAATDATSAAEQGTTSAPPEAPPQPPTPPPPPCAPFSSVPSSPALIRPMSPVSPATSPPRPLPDQDSDLLSLTECPALLLPGAERGGKEGAERDASSRGNADEEPGLGASLVASASAPTETVLDPSALVGGTARGPLPPAHDLFAEEPTSAEAPLQGLTGRTATSNRFSIEASKTGSRGSRPRRHCASGN